MMEIRTNGMEVTVSVGGFVSVESENDLYAEWQEVRPEARLKVEALTWQMKSLARELEAVLRCSLEEEFVAA